MYFIVTIPVDLSLFAEKSSDLLTHFDFLGALAIKIL